MCASSSMLGTGNCSEFLTSFYCSFSHWTALNEALTAEVQRLKLAANEVGDTSSSSNLAHQIQLRCQNQMLDLHKQQQQQVEQIPFYQLELPEQQNGTARNHESKWLFAGTASRCSSGPYRKNVTSRNLDDLKKFLFLTHLFSALMSP